MSLMVFILFSIHNIITGEEHSHCPEYIHPGIHAGFLSAHPSIKSILITHLNIHLSIYSSLQQRSRCLFVHHLTCCLPLFSANVWGCTRCSCFASLGRCFKRGGPYIRMTSMGSYISIYVYTYDSSVVISNMLNILIYTVGIHQKQ